MKAVIDVCRKIVNLATEVKGNNPDIGIMTADNIYQKLLKSKRKLKRFGPPSQRGRQRFIPDGQSEKSDAIKCVAENAMKRI